MKDQAWVDANIIIYFITGTPKEKAELALKLMQEAEAGHIDLRISAVTIAEVVWVLDSVFGFSPQEIAERLSAFIRAEGIEVSERDVLLETLVDYRDKNVDFVDAYLAAHARANGPRKVFTFDQHFERLGIEVAVPAITQFASEEPEQTAEQEEG